MYKYKHVLRHAIAHVTCYLYTVSL
jgi:hypothetical protein